MTSQTSLYPNFDVWTNVSHWDPHTESVVRERLHPPVIRILSDTEAKTLAQVCSRLLDESRTPLLDFLVGHFDAKLTSTVGEGQRQVGALQASVLIPRGLAALNARCEESEGQPFAELTPEAQDRVLQDVMEGSTNLSAGSDGVDGQAWFNKVLAEAVSAYYAHPTVWSEIGFAGPAYPRGYVRTERGLTDPWEAHQPSE